MGAWGLLFALTSLLAIPSGVYFLKIADVRSMTPLQESQLQLLGEVCPVLAACS
jgi:hypothetical protein